MACRVIKLNPECAAWVCTISEDTYQHYGLAPTPEEVQAQDRLHNFEEDFRREAELAERFIRSADVDIDWPWYADDPCIVEEPEVFGP